MNIDARDMRKVETDGFMGGVYITRYDQTGWNERYVGKYNNLTKSSKARMQEWLKQHPFYVTQITAIIVRM